MRASAVAAGQTPHRRSLRWALGAAATVFGVMTLRSGGEVLFGGVAARAEAGNIVEFVLTFNFGAGFAYVAAGVATTLGKRWAPYLARVLAVATLLVFAALGVHIATGGAFETRTVVAMIVRSAFWVGQAVALAHIFRNGAGGLPPRQR